MDTIWDRNPSKSKVIGRCGGNENTKMTKKNRHNKTPTPSPNLTPHTETLYFFFLFLNNSLYFDFNCFILNLFKLYLVFLI